VSSAQRFDVLHLKFIDCADEGDRSSAQRWILGDQLSLMGLIQVKCVFLRASQASTVHCQFFEFHDGFYDCNYGTNR